MKWKEQILQLHAYQPGKSIEEVKKQYKLDTIVKLASNENPYGHSPNVELALANLDTSFRFYPDAHASILREKLASHLQVNENQLLFTNGTDELIQLIARAILQPGKNTVMAEGTFPQYMQAAKIEGAEIREVPLIQGHHALDEMLAMVDEETAIIWICNPNNPTGTYLPITEIRHFLAGVPMDVLVVLDEAYHEYVMDQSDSLALLEEFPNLIIMRTFSKIYGLASFRVGYGIASPTIIQTLDPLRLPFNTNTLGQIAASAALSDQEFVNRCRERNAIELEKYYTFCVENELTYFPSQGNFLLMDLGRDADEVAEFLLTKGLIVRSGKALGFPTAIRITVGQEEQNERVRSALKELVAAKQRN